jgi:hypothetical protein
MTIIIVATINFISILNIYPFAVDGEAENSQSQLFQALEKHSRLFQITESRKAHYEGLFKLVRVTPLDWGSQEYSTDKFEGLYKSQQSPREGLSVEVIEDSHPFWLFKD